MMQFVRRYLGDEKATAALSVKTVADLNLATAIFCYENAGPTEEARQSAFEAAARYVTKAVELLPTIKDDCQRLLPPEAQPKS
jgi:hypothetical protein